MKNNLLDFKKSGPQEFQKKLQTKAYYSFLADLQYQAFKKLNDRSISLQLVYNYLGTCCNPNLFVSSSLLLYKASGIRTFQKLTIRV